MQFLDQSTIERIYPVVIEVKGRCDEAKQEMKSMDQFVREVMLSLLQMARG